MPKEVIRNGNPEDPQPFEMVVGWNRDMDVQVGIRIRDPRTSDEPQTLLRVLYGDDLQRIGDAMRQVALDMRNQQLLNVGGVSLGEVVLDVVERNASPGGLEPIPMDSIWWHPTRHGINSLIRTLRKARDAAFGKDE